MSTAADKSVRHILSISGGKAAPCFPAFDMLGPILTKQYPKPIVGGSMRYDFSLADLHTLHEWICGEMEKGAASSVLADFELSSCWTKDFCKVNELDAIGAKLAKFINVAAEKGGGR